MGYVQVWVDEECDGDCESAKEVIELEAKIDEAIKHLGAGYPDAALHTLTNDNALLVKSPGDISAKYLLWKAGKLGGFIPPEKIIVEASQ